MLLRQIFDPDLAQYSYLLACQRTGQALVVDPHRDIDRYQALAEEEGLEIAAVAETHIHADFLSGAREMVEQWGTRAYLSGEGPPDWQYGWRGGEESEEVTLLHDGDTFTMGSVELRVLATPGHTPEHLCFLVTDRGNGAESPMGFLTGDFLLVGDLGRPDLLELAGGGGSAADAARELFHSIGRLEGLEDDLIVWPGHGAGSSCGKSIGAVPVSTLGYERRYNESLRRAADGVEAFVAGILEHQPTPPSYFGRMKRTNRDGPRLLRRIPRPRRLDQGALSGITAHGETIVIDTRSARDAFMDAHLPGALYAPLGRTFSAAVGAVVTEETRQIVLVVAEDGLERAVRDLVRMGYDTVVGYLTPADLGSYLQSGGDSASIETIRFADVPTELQSGDRVVVDVRDHFEYEDGHIPGAISAPYTRLPEYLSSRIPDGSTLVVHCESGARSAVAAAWLAARGRDAIYVDDEWSRWVEQGGAVARGPDPRADGV